MKALIDAHEFLWFAWDDPRLSSTARGRMEDPALELFLSAGSVWGIGIKIGTGKLSVGQDLEMFLTQQMNRNRIALLPISVAHVRLVSDLPFHHKTLLIACLPRRAWQSKYRLSAATLRSTAAASIESGDHLHPGPPERIATE